MSGPQLNVDNKPTLYVLQSLKDNRTYVGSTDNFSRRLKQHNLGHVKSTKHRKPFKILFRKEYKTLKEARKQEQYYKSGAGRRKLKEIFDKNLPTKEEIENFTNLFNALREAEEEQKICPSRIKKTML